MRPSDAVVYLSLSALAGAEIQEPFASPGEGLRFSHIDKNSQKRILNRQKSCPSSPKIAAAAAPPRSITLSERGEKRRTGLKTGAGCVLGLGRREPAVGLRPFQPQFFAPVLFFEVFRGAGLIPMRGEKMQP